MKKRNLKKIFEYNEFSFLCENKEALEMMFKSPVRSSVELAIELFESQKIDYSDLMKECFELSDYVERYGGLDNDALSFRDEPEHIVDFVHGINTARVLEWNRMSSFPKILERLVSIKEIYCTLRGRRIDMDIGDIFLNRIDKMSFHGADIPQVTLDRISQSNLETLKFNYCWFLGYEKSLESLHTMKNIKTLLISSCKLGIEDEKWFPYFLDKMPKTLNHVSLAMNHIETIPHPSEYQSTYSGKVVFTENFKEYMKNENISSDEVLNRLEKIYPMATVIFKFY